MGAYVYRITAKRVRLSDGTEANVAVFAYKPYYHFGGEAANARMAFRSGCAAAERIKEIAPRIVLGERTTSQSGKTVKVIVDPDTHVYDNPRGVRTFIDDCDLGIAGRLPRADGVTVL